MTIRQQLAAGALITGLAISGAAGITAVALAQTATPQAAQPSRPHHSHIEGRIAFLKTELQITDAQQAQWDKLAAAMRENSQILHQAFEKMRANRDTPGNAVQRLETSAQIAALRAQADQRYLDAFRPLYASLSDDQKQTADELLGHRHHFHRR
jgi:Spy/CpxP family protein refolding chaperone